MVEQWGGRLTASDLLQLDVEDAFVGEDPEVVAFRFAEDGPESVQAGPITRVGQSDWVFSGAFLPEVDGGLTGIVLGGACEEGDALRGGMGDGGHQVAGNPAAVGNQWGPATVGEVQSPEVVQFVVLTRVALPS